MKAKIRLIGSIALTLLLLIVILHNTQAVETRPLFVTLTLPHALLLLATL